MGIDFDSWLESQDIKQWRSKHKNKKTNARVHTKVTCHLTLLEYMFKAWEAGIVDIAQINQAGFHLSRVGDIGDYTVENCRFLPCADNWAEMTRTPCPGERNGRAKLTSEQAAAIYISEDTVDEISLTFGCSTKTVQHIKNRRQWKSATIKFWPTALNL